MWTEGCGCAPVDGAEEEAEAVVDCVSTPDECSADWSMENDEGVLVVGWGCYNQDLAKKTAI